MFRLPTQEQLDAIRTGLANITDSSPLQQVGQLCLSELEPPNATYIVDYFPPQTFAGRTADFLLAWYSSDMYRLGEKPLWPPSAGKQTIYRLTYIPAFWGPQVVSLALQPDGSALLHIKSLDPDRTDR